MVETLEELLQGVSYLAYQRVQTQIELRPRPGVMQKLTVDPKELAAALNRDEVAANKSTAHKTGQSTQGQ